MRLPKLGGRGPVSVHLCLGQAVWSWESPFLSFDLDSSSLKRRASKAIEGSLLMKSSIESYYEKERKQYLVSRKMPIEFKFTSFTLLQSQLSQQNYGGICINLVVWNQMFQLSLATQNLPLKPKGTLELWVKAIHKVYLSRVLPTLMLPGWVLRILKG